MELKLRINIDATVNKMLLMFMYIILREFVPIYHYIVDAAMCVFALYDIWIQPQATQRIFQETLSIWFHLTLIHYPVKAFPPQLSNCTTKSISHCVIFLQAPILTKYRYIIRGFQSLELSMLKMCIKRTIPRLHL